MPPPNALTIRATDRPAALPTLWADAAEATNDNVLAPIRARIAAERAQSVAMGLLDPETGLPTAAGLKQAAMAYAKGLGDSGGVNALTGMIRAYHGSPHMFDRFDMSKIGTGEGAQAYGHGLYMAGNEAVARGYRDRLSAPTYQTIDGTPISHSDALSAMYHNITAAGGHPNAATPIAAEVLKAIDDAGNVKSAVRRYQFPDDTRYGPLYQEAIASAQRMGLKTNPGHMYEVNINARPDQLLDWDKPLAGQSSYVQSVAPPALGGNMPVGTKLGMAYRNPMHGGDVAGVNAALPSDVSAALRDAGIPGIQYLDQASRGVGEGSHNYVIFDDKLIDIMRRYGLPGVVTGGAAFAPDYTGRYTEQ